jgi:hypothetical protein
MVGVAQLVERWTVTPEVAGSNPVAHPTFQQSVCGFEIPRCVRTLHAGRIQVHVTA